MLRETGKGLLPGVAVGVDIEPPRGFLHLIRDKTEAITFKRAAEQAVIRRQWDVVRVAILFVLLFLIYVEPNPTSVTAHAQGAAGVVEGQFFQQMLWPILALVSCTSISDRSRAILDQFDLFLVAALVWYLLTTFDAIEPDVSFRRFMFMFFVVLSLIILISAIEDNNLLFQCLLAVGAFATVYAYFYVFFRPVAGLHQATGLDNKEPQLVGLWRGQYAHKSISGLVFGMFLLVAARIRPPLAYCAVIILLQAVFLLKSGDKTILYLFVPIFILVSLILRMRSVPAILSCVVIPIALINAITIGSIYFDSLRTVAAQIVGTASFTGRPELWKLLIDYSVLHPWMGSGFQSFWQLNTNSPAQFYGGTWLKDAFYGHQSFLDLMAATGVPGLVLGLLFVIVRPALDLSKIKDRRNPMVAAFVTMWILPLYQGATESIFFEKTSASWIFLLLGIIGLRKVFKEQSIGAVSQRIGSRTPGSPQMLSATFGLKRREQGAAAARAR